MSGFSTLASPGAAQPDPTKHVNYTLGMVLGVDDFTQEFAYLSNRDQLLARTLHGYGTVCGLRVTYSPNDGNPQMIVEPGMAVTPRGQFVSVPVTQCAQINAWLQANSAEVEQRRQGVDPSAPLPLYVVLCYRECPTDMAPIPGEPCRSEDEAMAPARLADDYRLELRFVPPEQTEEQALRAFVDWLNDIEIVAGGASSTSLEDFAEAVRQALSTAQADGAALQPAAAPLIKPGGGGKVKKPSAGSGLPGQNLA